MNLVMLMVTTEVETSQMLRALSAGADEYLMKPFQRDGLVDKLRMLPIIGTAPQNLPSSHIVELRSLEGALRLAVNAFAE